jgi:levansucrase
VADTLDGPFEPLNGTGLVIANPPDAQFQAYSWMGHPNGVVTSFFQFFDIGDVGDIDYIGDQSPEFQLEHFGGTFAPSIHVEFDGDTTRIVEELAPGGIDPER